MVLVAAVRQTISKMISDFDWALSESPRRLNDKLIIAYVVANRDVHGEVEVADRVLQTIFVRSARGHLSARLNMLETEGWLSSSQNWRRGQGTKYKLGQRFTDPQTFKEWHSFSSILFGPTGLLAKWLGHSLLTHGSVQPLGLLIIEIVRQQPKTWNQTGISRLLSCLCRQETIQKKVRSLVKLGLITTDRGRLSLANDADSRLLDLSSKGPEIRRTRIERRIRAERIVFYERLGISERRLALSRSFKGQTCIRCTKRSDELEHVPPRSWGGEDDWFLTYPICGGCNSDTKNFIQNNPLALGADLLKEIPENVLPLEHLSVELFRLTQCFYRAVELNDQRTAHRVINTQLRMFTAYCEYPTGINSSDTQALFGFRARMGAYQLPAVQEPGFLNGRPPLTSLLTRLPIGQTQIELKDC